MYASNHNYRHYYRNYVVDNTRKALETINLLQGPIPLLWFMSGKTSFEKLLDSDLDHTKI